MSVSVLATSSENAHVVCRRHLGDLGLVQLMIGRFAESPFRLGILNLLTVAFSVWTVVVSAVVAATAAPP